LIELAPGWTFSVEDRHPHHVIATCGDVVIVIAHRGSHDDTRHVEIGGRVVEQHHARRGAKLRVLFAIAAHGKPPSADVRGRMREAILRLRGMTSRVAVVLEGEGFGAAIQRGVVTGGLALRADVETKVVATVREGLEALVDPHAAAFFPLLRACEALLGDPMAPVEAPAAASSSRPRPPTAGSRLLSKPPSKPPSR
jgi:hypothetical protein